MVDRFSQHVHLKHGGLGDWCEHCSTTARHDALRDVARRDGAGTVSRRLNYLANVANRSNNRKLHEIARRDQRWVERHLESDSSRRE